MDSTPLGTAPLGLFGMMLAAFDPASWAPHPYGVAQVGEGGSTKELLSNTAFAVAASALGFAVWRQRHTPGDDTEEESGTDVPTEEHVAAQSDEAGPSDTTVFEQAVDLTTDDAPPPVLARQPPPVLKAASPAGSGPWIEVRGQRWEGTFEYRESDRLGFADAGTARVYRGRDTKTGKEVCIKVAAKSGGQMYNDRTTWDRMLNSRVVRAAGGWIGLPQLLARVYSFGPGGSEEALVCELCGPSLGWCLKQRRDKLMSTTEACAVGIEVLRHIRHMHSVGFAHRDISTANLLLPHQPEPAGSPLLCIIDFGLAQPLSMCKTKQDCSGTLRFATSNIGITPLDPRDDLQGLGYVLLAALAGSLPWDADLDNAPNKAAAKKQFAAVCAAKATMLQDGVGAFGALSPTQTKLIDQYFAMLTDVGAAVPYDALHALLHAAGCAATDGAFPPASLSGLLPPSGVPAARRRRSSSPKVTSPRQSPRRSVSPKAGLPAAPPKRRATSPKLATPSPLSKRITTMKVNELREALSARGVDARGLKAALVDRLQAAEPSASM